MLFLIQLLYSLLYFVIKPFKTLLFTVPVQSKFTALRKIVPQTKMSCLFVTKLTLEKVDKSFVQVTLVTQITAIAVNSCHHSERELVLKHDLLIGVETRSTYCCVNSFSKLQRF